MKTLPFRGVLTDALVAHLQADADLAARHVLVGDGLVPDLAGWPVRTPGKGTYVAAVVLSTGEASPAQSRDTYTSHHGSWICTYGLSATGATRSQCDAAADHGRAATIAFPRSVLTLGPVRWKVADVYFAALSRIEPVMNVDPPTWRCDDTVLVRLERERT